ncbi:MAG: hypothetical protein IPK93_04170 [Solirubrobacterales bacterium]|nr:hypothetical protein [Solirubrobacterales bacterium]
MAEEPEKRMLFDLRGKRKRVIQVIYVMLAIIMGASLVVIGLPGGVNPFSSGNGAVSQDLADSSIARAEKIQKKLVAEPNNTNAQEELIRARIAAGNNLISIDQDTGAQTVTEAASTQYDLAAQAWEYYLKATKNQPEQSVAQVIANTLFTLSQDSTVAQFETNIRDAAKAQAFVAGDVQAAAKKGGPNAAPTLATLATYQFYAQQTAEAQATTKRALAATPDKAEQKQIKTQLASVEKDAARIGKILAKAKKQAKKDGGKSLEQPAGSLGSSSALTTPQTTP